MAGLRVLVKTNRFGARNVREENVIRDIPKSKFEVNIRNKKVKSILLVAVVWLMWNITWKNPTHVFCITRNKTARLFTYCSYYDYHKMFEKLPEQAINLVSLTILYEFQHFYLFRSILSFLYNGFTYFFLCPIFVVIHNIILRT